MVKKALLVGLNAYPAPITSLQGCANDVRQMERTLERYYQFQPEDIRILLDRDASREAILAGLAWLVGGAGPGDVLVFHYSGHGSQVPDLEEEEYDGFDEILVPYDHDWNNPLRDDDLRQCFAGLPTGAGLTVVLDCCHSGTGIKGEARPRRLAPPPELQAQIRARVARRSAAGHIGADPDKNRFAFVTPTEGHALLAGCRDNQVSADALIGGTWHGAFTYALVRALLAGGGSATYEGLIEGAEEWLRGEGEDRRYDQVPQLECAEALKATLAFQPFAD